MLTTLIYLGKIMNIIFCKGKEYYIVSIILFEVKNNLKCRGIRVSGR